VLSPIVPIHCCADRLRSIILIDRHAKTTRVRVIGRPGTYCVRMAGPVRRLRIGPGCGHLTIRTGREGLAARVGHDLTIDATGWSGELSHDAGDLAATTLTVTVDLGLLRVRDGSGGVVPLTDRDRTEINATMARILGAGAGASAMFVADRVIPAAGGGSIDGALTIRGTGRPLSLTVVHGDAHRYHGTAVVSQSAYGIKPYSGMFGTLKVRDDVQIEFDVDLDGAQRVAP
jgi:polyisoprenoid-binding protein YceI